MPWWGWALVGCTGLSFVPALAIALMLGGVVVLQTVGFLIRATANERGAARLWAMDRSLAVPRSHVAALFLLAGLGAPAGAVRLPGRRPLVGSCRPDQRGDRRGQGRRDGARGRGGRAGAAVPAGRRGRPRRGRGEHRAGPAL